MREDKHDIRAKYAVAQQCNLDNMADATIDAFEELKAKFEAAQEAHIQEIIDWESWSPPEDNPDIFHPQGAPTGQPIAIPAWNFGTFQEFIPQTSGG